MFAKTINKMVKTDVRDDINIHLKEIQRNYRWLSKNTGIKYATIYAIFKQRTVKLSDERKETINTLLGTNF